MKKCTQLDEFIGRFEKFEHLHSTIQYNEDEVDNDEVDDDKVCI